MGKFIEARLTTALGEVNAVSWGDEFVIQSLYEDGRDLGISINRVRYSVRLDVKYAKAEDDGEKVWSISHLYISRLNGLRYDEATYSARSKAKHFLLAALLLYVREHPEFVDSGNLYRLEDEIARKRDEEREASAKAQQIRGELDKLLQEYATSTKQPLFTTYHDTRKD